MPAPRAQAALRDPEVSELAADPTPGRKGPGRPRKATIKAPRSTGGQFQSTAQMKRQVATELYGFASLFVGIWGMKDPDCAGVLTESVQVPGGGDTERLSAIVEQVVEILGRNDKVLSALANAGLIGQIGMLASLTWPVARQVWKAHGPNGLGHGDEGELADVYSREYPAPSLAGV